MRVVAFSINPLFPDKINGGGVKHLQNIATHLGEQGHTVDVLCTRRADSFAPFQWHPRVTVHPVLPFKQPFPQPYDISLPELTEAVRILNDFLETADRFYLHDSQWLIPDVYSHIPTVAGVRDNAYPETGIGLFNCHGDVLIAISEYSRRLYLETVGQVYPGLKERIMMIPNGFDFEFYKPGQASAEIREWVNLPDDQGPVVLHPHRPEPAKGLEQTLAVAEKLIREYGFSNLKVLVSRWFDETISGEVREYYRKMEEAIRDKGLEKNFHFHPWIPRRLVPDYYRLGNLTLTLGSFIESFGNVPCESLACGTPVIVSRVGPHRSIFPDRLIDKVAFGDTASAARLGSRILRDQLRSSPEALEFLKSRFDARAQLDQYTQVILNVQKRPPLVFDARMSGKSRVYRLSCWCDLQGDEIYHDFLGRPVHQPILADLCRRYQRGFQREMVLKEDVEGAALEKWVQEGFLTCGDESDSGSEGFFGGQ